MSNPTLYATAKQVPAMLGGFTIATGYGDLELHLAEIDELPRTDGGHDDADR